MPQFATGLPVPNTPLVKPEHLSQMVSDLFVTMLGMPVNSTETAPMAFHRAPVQACVRVSGDWHAVIRVVASEKFALLVACAMFGLEAKDVSEDEVLDALGEVANVIGGNAKGLVDKNCDLSIPCVGGEVNDEIEADTIHLSFECQGELVHIVLAEK